MPMAFFLLLVVFFLTEDFREFDGVYELTQGHDAVRVLGGVLDQFAQPAGFQGKADAQHEVGIGHSGNVLCAGPECMRVGVWRK